jgi:hypothetical protein
VARLGDERALAPTPSTKRTRLSVTILLASSSACGDVHRDDIRSRRRRGEDLGEVARAAAELQCALRVLAVTGHVIGDVPLFV